MFVVTLIAQKDANIIRDSFIKAGSDIIVHHFTDNLLFIDFLHEAGRFPDMIIIDVDSALYDGLEVLATIKSRLYWSKIPTVILSGAAHKNNKEKFLHLGASSFYHKPSDPAGYNRLVAEVLENYYPATKTSL